MLEKALATVMPGRKSSVQRVYQTFRLTADEDLRLSLDRFRCSAGLNLLRFPPETSYHPSDAVPKLIVLGGVDERVDTGNGKHIH